MLLFAGILCTRPVYGDSTHVVHVYVDSWIVTRARASSAVSISFNDTPHTRPAIFVSFYVSTPLLKIKIRRQLSALVLTEKGQCRHEVLAPVLEVAFRPSLNYSGSKFKLTMNGRCNHEGIRVATVHNSLRQEWTNTFSQTYCAMGTRVLVIVTAKYM